MLCRIVEVPLALGAGQTGCELAPAALRQVGLIRGLRANGWTIEERLVRPHTIKPVVHPNSALKSLPEVVAWTSAIAEAAFTASCDVMPIFLGGDHAISAGTLTGLARQAAASRRAFFLLWLDAHPDLHTPDTSVSGNLHGVPLAYAIGREGFAGYFPPLRAPVRSSNICMIGVRSVDAPERRVLDQERIEAYDAAALRSRGATAILRPFLDRVAAANGLLHVSLDVDFLDPSIAPGADTTVPDGAGIDDALDVMRIVNDSGLMTSLDLVELNPRLDNGSTATLLASLATKLVGPPRRLDQAG